MPSRQRTGTRRANLERSAAVARSLIDHLIRPAWACRLLGEIARLHLSPLADSAEGYYRKALALAEPRSMRPLIAHCHAGLARLCRRTGKHQEANEHFVTATSMYRDMGMTYWLEKAEAEMRELGRSREHSFW
jgi:hypothetical protein